MMKKFISLVLAAAMLAALGLTAFAVDITNAEPDAQEVIIKTSTLKDDGASSETYEVTIPATTVIAWEAESTDLNYSAAAQLEWNHRLEISVAGNGAMAFDPDASNHFELPYALTGDGADEATSDGPVLLASDDAATKTLNVAIAADAWKLVPIAEYADTLTFTAEIVPVTVSGGLVGA